MKLVFDTCIPRDEVLRGELREEQFAARLKDVAEGRADSVYQDPATFFDYTYPTEGLRDLLQEALGRLTGQTPSANAIIRLETAFGGGKTHNLIALYHLAMGHADPGWVTGLVSPNLIPAAGATDVAAVVGHELDPVTGLAHEDGVTTYTLWGELAWQLGRYEVLAENDRKRTAPGTATLERLVGDKPVLVLLDEVARHLRATRAVKVAKSTQADQTVAFLMSLWQLAGSQEQTVVVYTLATSGDAFRQETEELTEALAEAQQVSARQERVITPTGETEMSAIVTHRLFRETDRKAAQRVAAAYARYYRDLLERETEIPHRAARSEFHDEVVDDYPFHPDLLTTLSRKTSTIPLFQKTRGALRLLAMVVRRLWQDRPGDALLIHPHHLNLADDGILNDLTSRLGRPQYRSVVEADIISPRAGSQAHAQLVDEPGLAIGRPPYARRVATTVFLHSLTQGVASGVDAADALLPSLQPGDDPALVQRALDQLVDCAWFLDFDGRRYRFSTEPQLNKVVSDEAGLVGRTDARAELDRRIRQMWPRHHLKPEYFPNEPADVDDDSREPKLVVLHYDAAVARADDSAPPDLVRRLAERAGRDEAFRVYRNHVFFLVADGDKVEPMIEATRRYVALNRIVGDADRMGQFSNEQKRRLRKMHGEAEADIRVAVTRAYSHLYYPATDAPQKHANLARELMAPQDAAESEPDQTQVVLGELRSLRKVRTADDPQIPAHFVQAKAWDANQVEMTTEGLRRAFAHRLSLPVLMDINQMKRCIQDGITQGLWVYYDPDQGVGFGTQAPPPAVKVTDEVYLYAPERARERNIPIRGEEEAPEPTCPVCGQPASACTCARVVETVDWAIPQLRGEGVPARAFADLLAACQDSDVTLLGTLALSLEGRGRDVAGYARALALAVPQISGADVRVEHGLATEFGDSGHCTVDFAGPWARYKGLRPLAEAVAQQADEVHTRMRLILTFGRGLAVPDDVQALQEVLTDLAVGSIEVEGTAAPFPEARE